MLPRLGSVLCCVVIQQPLQKFVIREPFTSPGIMDLTHNDMNCLGEFCYLLNDLNLLRWDFLTD